jgi:nitroreductase
MMRKGVKADSRFDFEELFFDGSFDQPLTKEKAGKLSDALEGVRLAPSAVNKQPWRVLVTGDKVHFYEKRSKGYLSEDGWDRQKIDMGIALCHFGLVMRECGSAVSFEIADPSIPVPEDTFYIGTFVSK